MKPALRRWIAGFGLLLMAGGAAAVLPPEWRIQGQGEMRWFGFRLYQASLWAPQGRWQADLPYALELRYARDIPSARLVQASIEEMQRLGSPTTRAWRAGKSSWSALFPTCAPTK